MPGPGWAPRWSRLPWPALPLRPAQSRLSPPASLRHGDGSVPPATWSLGLGPQVGGWKVVLASLMGGAATGLLVWALVASLFHKVPLVILGARHTEHPPKTGGHPPAE